MRMTGMRLWCFGGLCGLLCGAALLHAAENRVRIWSEGEYRYVESNGIPDHATGTFPNSGNPNTITEQSHRFRMPVAPQRAAQRTPLGMHPFGVAVNGVPFDPGAAEFWNNDRQSGWQYEALSEFMHLGLDEHHAHVQPSGAYHYHGLPEGIAGPLLGYAADGFPIYRADSSGVAWRSSYRVKSGTRPSGPGGAYDGRFVQDYEFVTGAGDLDACNGREAATAEYPQGTYCYVVTPDFPFIPRCFTGTPDASFLRAQGAPPARGARPTGGATPPTRPDHPPGAPPHPPGHRPPPPAGAPPRPLH